MDALKILAKGAGYAFFGYGLSKFLGYLYRVLIAHISPQIYGELSIAIAITGIASLVSLLGLNTGVTRYIAFYHAQQNTEKIHQIIHTALFFACCLGVLFSVMLFLLAPALAAVYQQPSLVLLFRVFAIGIPFYVLRDVLLAATRGFQRAEYEVCIRMILENAMKVFLAYIFLFMGLAAFGAALANTIALFFSALLSFYVVEKYVFPVATKIAIDKAVTKELLAYSLPVLFSTLVTQVFVWSDLLMMGIFRTLEEVGIYNTALPTATLLSILPGGIITLFLPVMTELHTKNKPQEFIKTYQSCAKWIFFATVPFFVFLVSFAPELLSLIFGEQYATGGAALSILAIGYIIYHTFSPSVEVLNAIKKTHVVMINIIIAALLNIILNLLLIPDYGMIGGAIATTASMTILGILAFLEGLYYVNIQPIQKSFAKAVVAAGLGISIVYWASLFVTVPMVYRLPIFLFCHIIIYVTTIIASKGYDDTDKDIFLRGKKKIWKTLRLPVEE